MEQGTPTPSVTLIPPEHGGGFLVAFAGFSGRGETLDAAIAALNGAMRETLHSEKGDEGGEAETARKQADILANDRFIRGAQFQHTVLLGAALGLI